MARFRCFFLGLFALACGSSDDGNRLTSTGSDAGDSGGDVQLDGAAGATGGAGGAPVICTPAQNTACYGEGLCLGSHTCNAEGTSYSECACPDGSASGGGPTTDAAEDGPDSADALTDSTDAPIADAGSDATSCPEPCSSSVNYPWVVKSGAPVDGGLNGKAVAECLPGSQVDTNSTSKAALYCWGECSLNWPSAGSFQCVANAGAPVGSCEIHFRCQAYNWCTALMTTCPN